LVKQCTGAHIYTTTHGNKTVNVDENKHIFITFVIFIYKGQKIEFVVSENCLIHVKEFQKKIAGDTLTAVREVSKQYRYETGTVLMLGE
jgi:hypothetical protein